MTVVSTIQFSGYPGANPAQSALLVRPDRNTAMALPEYSVHPHHRWPAVYARDPVVNHNPRGVKIIVTFKEGPPNGVTKIHAEGGGILGAVPQKDVRFDQHGDSAEIPFTLATNLHDKSPVGADSFAWEWKEQIGPDVHDMPATAHSIFVVINSPNPPWTQGGSVNDESDPWLTALDLAVAWATGATTIPEAATRITEKANLSGSGYMGAREFTKTTGVFMLSTYLKLLELKLSFNMNCSDFASVVTTLTNLIGGDYLEGKIKKFTTKPILPAAPGIARADWAYHEICFDKFDNAGKIWDASLQIVDGKNRNLPTPLSYKDFNEYIAALASGPPPRRLKGSAQQRLVR